MHVSQRDLVHYQCIYYYIIIIIIVGSYFSCIWKNTMVKMLGKALFLLQLCLKNAMVKTVGKAL